ncbi:MAG: HNH endonuclease signature motif containing protein [Beijerinckiaceae bacterium]
MLRELPSQEMLRTLLNYDPETGLLTWRARTPNLFAAKRYTAERACKIWNTKNAGKLALNIPDAHGYRVGAIAQAPIKAHRAIWKLVTGEDPEFIDHINGDRSDNRWCNLRNVTRLEQQRNLKTPASNKSGCRGVHWDKSREKWVAAIQVKGRSQHLGRFVSKTQAIAARKSAERRFGFHPNHGRPA